MATSKTFVQAASLGALVKAALDGDSGGLKTAIKAAIPKGVDGVGIQSSALDASGNLRLTKTDGTAIEVGVVKGDPGPAGSGFAAAPTGDAAKDSATIRDAMARRLQLQSGTYEWDGVAEDTTYPYVVGAGSGATTIHIPDGKYLIDSNKMWWASEIRGVWLEGGTGAIRNRYTGGNVTSTHIVEKCYFRNQVYSCVTSEAVDMPYWRIRNNVFNPADEVTSVCIALPDVCKANITDNAFFRYRVGIKIGPTGANGLISGNDFIHYDSGTGVGRHPIWKVPKGTDWQGNVDAGSGTVIESNKFGNENIAQGDTRILFAGEGPGETFAERLPDLQPVEGYVTGLFITKNMVAGNNDASPPLITSYTPNFVSSDAKDNHFTGTLPEQLLWYDDVTAAKITSHREVTIGPVTRQWADASTESFLATNAPVEHFWVETRHPSEANQLLPKAP